MKRKALLLVLFLSCFLSTMAQQTDTTGSKTVWTLQECVNYAMANNLRVKRSELSLELSNFEKRHVKLALLP